MLDIQLDPDRNMIRGLLVAANFLVDLTIRQEIGGLWRQQDVVDPNAIVLVPRASLIIPERVLLGCL